MSSAAFFHRDPRELPFLHEQVKKVLALADSASRNLSIREDDDPGFMAAQFLYKQMQHTESILMLIPRRDAGLIARTMIDGLYQLLWTVQSPDERARLWRSYSVIHDWRLIRGRLREGIPVDPAEIRATEARLKVLGPLHQLKKPRPNSSDPYHRTWHGGVKLADMADVVGRELYDNPYAELSDWEHWGVSGIGESIVLKNGRGTVRPNSDRIAGLALLAAFQCLLQTLEVVDIRLSLNMSATIHALGKEFRDTLDSFYRSGGGAGEA
ncbi:MAG: DUF5677 domain-containing protein [Acidobacteriaceae bacterium]